MAEELKEIRLIRQITDLLIRSDSAGDGHYGAPRGNRTHCGIDYCCEPGSPILSPIVGTVTKHGYPYGDDLSWRYIQITDHDGMHHRLFYVKPQAPIGVEVTASTQVGLAQDIAIRYPGQGMTPHVHYEIMNDAGEYTNPMST